MVNGQPTLTTVEHEYQAQKFELAFHDPAYAAHIRSIPVNHPEQAKHAGGQGGWITSKHGSIMIGGKTPCGRTVSNVGRRPPSKQALKDYYNTTISKHWINKSVPTMMVLLSEKFDRRFNEELAVTLMQTGNRPLHEIGRGHGFWIKSGGDMLGKLLTKQREDLNRRREVIVIDD